MRRTVRNGVRRFDAECGHEVGACMDYIETSDGDVLEATVRRWCSPTCADRGAGQAFRMEAHTLCRWKGCTNAGTPRDVAVTLPAAQFGGAILATFSDDVPLCDEHADALEAKMIEELTRAIEEDGNGEDGNG